MSLHWIIKHQPKCNFFLKDFQEKKKFASHLQKSLASFVCKCHLYFILCSEIQKCYRDVYSNAKKTLITEFKTFKTKFKEDRIISVIC